MQKTGRTRLKGDLRSDAHFSAKNAVTSKTDQPEYLGQNVRFFDAHGLLHGGHLQVNAEQDVSYSHRV